MRFRENERRQRRAHRVSDGSNQQMDLDNLDATVAFMRDHWHLITADESSYKPGIAATVWPVFEAAAAGDPEWPASLKKTYKEWSQQIGWRCASAFVDYVKDYPVAIGDAIRNLHGPIDADDFWHTAFAPVGGREGLKNGFAQLSAPGTRGSLVSLVLFSRDHESFPIYRARNSAVPLTKLLGEPLDKRSIASTLISYYAGITRLGKLLKERGLPVRNNLDVQGVLWVVHDNKLI